MQDTESSHTGQPYSTLPIEDLHPRNDFATIGRPCACFYAYSDDTVNQGNSTLQSSTISWCSLHSPPSIHSNVYQLGVLHQQEDSRWIHPGFSLTESQSIAALYAGLDYPLGPVIPAQDCVQDVVLGSILPEVTSFQFESDPTPEQLLLPLPTHTYASPPLSHMEQAESQIQPSEGLPLADVCFTAAIFSHEQGLLQHPVTDFAPAFCLDNIAQGSLDFSQKDMSEWSYGRSPPYPQPSPHEVERASRTDVTLMQHQSTPRNVILANAFTESSCRPSPALRALLEYIQHSDFILLDAHEPVIADDYSICALAHINALANCPSIEFESLNHSIFSIFVDRSTHCCLFCGSYKSSLARAVGCVRAHLGHRPFYCTGCRSCDVINGYTHFSTAALLRDHLNGQEKKIECIRCHTKLRRGGMKRHWNSIHKGEIFPFHNYPRYRRDDVAPTQSSSSACVTPDFLEDTRHF